MDQLRACSSFTVTGWLTAPYHGIDGAWIAIIAFSVLVNTGILDWGMMRKGIDWELLIHMGVTLSIPTLLKAGEDRSVARRCDLAIDSSVHGQSGMVFFRHRGADLCAQAGFHQLSRGGHALRRLAAAIHRRRHEPVDHRHDYS